jgi:O-antigen/teichoic acid export membrane protein
MGKRNSDPPAVNGAMLARSSFYELASMVSRTALKLIQTPIVLTVLDIERYGIFTLIFVLAVYIEQFNVSFGFAYAKFTAEFDVRRDFKTLATLISSGIVLVMAGASVVLAVFLIFRYPVLSFLGVRDIYLEDAAQAFGVVMAALVIRLSVGCYWRMLAGLQRIDLQKKIEIAANVLEIALSLVLLFTLGGVISLALAFLAHEAFLAAASWLTWRRLRPPLGLSPWKVTRYGFRRVLSLGGKFQVLALLGMAITQSVKLTISAVFGPVFLGLFDLADKIINMGRMAPMAVINPLLPAFTNLHTRGATAEAHALYLRVSRVLSLLTLLVFGFVFLAPDLFLFGWTGGAYRPAPLVLQILCVSAVVHLLTGVGTASLRSRESLAYEFKYCGWQLIIMLVLFFPLLHLWGFLGVTTAFSLGFGSGACWFLVAYARREAIPVRVYLRSVVLEPGLRVGTVLAAFGLLKLAWPALFSVDGGRLQVLIRLGVLGTAFVAAVGAAVWFSNLLDARERAIVLRLRDRLPFLRAWAVPEAPAAEARTPGERVRS